MVLWLYRATIPQYFLRFCLRKFIFLLFKAYILKTNLPKLTRSASHKRNPPCLLIGIVLFKRSDTQRHENRYCIIIRLLNCCVWFLIVSAYQPLGRLDTSSVSLPVRVWLSCFLCTICPSALVNSIQSTIGVSNS